MRQAFGLAFDIQRDPSTRSGFSPAPTDLGAGLELFGPLRLRGFAAMLRMGFVDHLTVVGGDEGRYKNEQPVINRAWAICEMLIHDFGIVPDRVSFVASKSNTLGNVGIIAERTRSPEDIVVTSHYHVPRALMDIEAAGLAVKMRCAEAFILLEDMARKDVLKEEIIAELGGNAKAERDGEEIQGIAQKLEGTYKSRTDAAPIVFGSSEKTVC